MDQPVALGADPQTAVAVGHDGADLTREVGREPLHHQIRGYRVPLGIHHRAAAVHADPEGALLGILAEAEDSQIAVDDLLAVSGGGVETHQSVGAESYHEVLVKRHDAHDGTVTRQQRIDIADKYLGLPPDVVYV